MNSTETRQFHTSHKMYQVKCFLTMSVFAMCALSISHADGGYPSSSYGGYSGYAAPKKYPYLPAPPGETPTCAKNGATYCEKVETYPTEVISYLLYKWGRHYQQFIKSETNEDYVRVLSKTYGPAPYDTYKAPQSSGGYSDGPSSSYLPQDTPPTQGYKGNGSNPNLVASYYRGGNTNNRHQREQGGASGGGYGYTFTIPPTQGNAKQGGGSSSGGYGQGSDAHTMAAAIPPILHSIWWNHRDPVTNQEVFPQVNQYNQHQRWKRRAKRQAPEDQLCSTFSSYITPQAAMTQDGNWMYVVNMDSSQYIQRVRSEQCVEPDGPCNGVCSVPPDFRTSCKQKYVQKRLVALDGSGESLRNDVFWFPHCCICEVER